MVNQPYGEPSDNNTENSCGVVCLIIYIPNHLNFGAFWDTCGFNKFEPDMGPTLGFQTHRPIYVSTLLGCHKFDPPTCRNCWNPTIRPSHVSKLLEPKKSTLPRVELLGCHKFDPPTCRNCWNPTIRPIGFCCCQQVSRVLWRHNSLALFT